MQESIKHDTVLDTGAEQLGATYAAALLGAASSAGAVDEVLEQLSELVSVTLREHASLAAAFRSPRVSIEEKQRVLDRLFGDQMHPVLLRFLKVAAVRGRLGYLPAILRAAQAQQDELLGRVVAEVRSAVALTDELREQIRARLSQVFAKDVRLEERVDPEVIGGVVIRVGDTVFDSSVSGQLESMSRRASAGFARHLRERFDQFTTAT
ncbi:ATP synthase F1 subunit delta [Roseimaritima sediminicola]|uniref:ATP synthase F1 subunit delta n=1 Tax=Roseimaritima sediminicola TaxID=2662066 RepID=UPI00129836C7|nr:ATP synthase F1 subunit delta [Roseimaritima sediminicola]